MLLLLLACTETPERVRRSGAPDPGVDTAAADTAVDTAVDTAARDSAVDTEPPVTPAVTILAPADGALVANPVRFELQLQGVDHAVLDADGYEIATLTSASEPAFEYVFSGTGYERVVTLTGYGADGAVAAQDVIRLEVEPDEVSLDVPYFYQYDNTNEPGSTCGVTSAAMLVDWFHPGSVTPDSLYRTYGKAQGQAPDTLAALYESEGLYADFSYGGSRADIRGHLDAGRPVVVHGYWTGAGHITVIVGYSDTDWIVNDPAGDWYDCYGCGEADHVRYPMGGAWDDEMSVDGDVWYSTADDSPF